MVKKGKRKECERGANYWTGMSYYLLIKQGWRNFKKQQWNQQMRWNLYTEMYKKFPSPISSEDLEKS